MRYQLINKKDYELYNIHLPFMLKKNRRNAFITRELEKIHPCFSESSCFDSKLHLKKSGLVASVVVMDKLKLAQYKRLGKSRLRLDEIRKRIVFNPEKKYLLFLPLVLFILFFTCFVFAVQKKTSKISKENLISESKKVEPVKVTAACDAAKSFFTILLKSGALVDFYSFDSSSQVQKFNIRHSLPQIFDCDEIRKMSGLVMKFSPVVYKKMMSSYSLELSPENFYQNFSEKTGLNGNDMNKIRKLLDSYGVNKISDDMFAGLFNFESNKKNFSKLFFDLDNLCKSENLELINLELSVGKNIITCSLSLSHEKKSESKNGTSTSILHVLSDCESVFFEKRQNITKKIASVNEKNSDEFPPEKIGVIKTGEGKVISYYKNSDGKIIGVEE